jgi:LuxR family transcriptional regulator, maltose regulon positive regulatory protein
VVLILSLRALARERQDDAAGARADLERALTLAAPEGYVRSFVDAGAPMAALLAQYSERHAQNHAISAYAARLLAAFPDRRAARAATDGSRIPAIHPTPHAAALVEPLTEREREILHLVAAGSSNQAIADELVVAVSTVKKHINNLYGKLAVQSRTQALVRARELDLLT